MSETDDGRRAPFPRDTPQRTPLTFDRLTALQQQGYELQDLHYSLSAVIAVLSDAPGVSMHPAVSAADTLIRKATATHNGHLSALEGLDWKGGGK